MTNKCKVRYCKNTKIRSLGLCNKHYLRLKRHGNPLKKTRAHTKKLDFKIDVNGCFICTSHKEGHNGYPQLQHKGIPSPAHRKVYEEMFGAIPENMLVRHKCDNRLCINPEHLEIGTHSDNLKDAYERNTLAYGERISSSKLKEKDVIKINKLLQQESVNKSLVKNIAKKFNVHHNTIYDIYYGRTWKRTLGLKE